MSSSKIERNQPKSVDYLGDLESGRMGIEDYLRFKYSVVVKEPADAQEYPRGEEKIGYRPFVTSVSVEGEDDRSYGDYRPISVTVKRGDGAVESGWSAIGITSRLLDDGSSKDYYLVEKTITGSQGIPRTYSKIVDILQTERLSAESEEAITAPAIGASAVAKVVTAPAESPVSPSSELQRIGDEIDGIVEKMRWLDIEGNRGDQYRGLDNRLAELRKIRADLM